MIYNWESDSLRNRFPIFIFVKMSINNNETHKNKFTVHWKDHEKNHFFKIAGTLAIQHSRYEIERTTQHHRNLCQNKAHAGVISWTWKSDECD